MRIHFPNSAFIGNIQGFLGSCDVGEPDRLDFSMHDKWVAVHPVVLAMTACAAHAVRQSGGNVTGQIHPVRSLPYLIRMGLFNHLGLDPGVSIIEHEEAGRFIPLTQIRDKAQLSDTISNLVPLLHAPPFVADPIRYVFSEMVRNTLEHAASPVGAFVCAQYFKKTRRISVGIADAGLGIRQTISQSHSASSHEGAIELALQPGITGVTSRIGGNEYNAGAGLFFTKSIASLSRNYFLLYSGNAAYKLLKSRPNDLFQLSAHPRHDRHRFIGDLPEWQGTVVGIDINVESDTAFSDLLETIRGSYFIDVKNRKDYSKRIRFAQ